MATVNGYSCLLWCITPRIVGVSEQADKQGDKMAVRTRDQIQDEVNALRAQLKVIEKRREDTLFPIEDLMESASITVRLAALWEEWQHAEWGAFS